jgi:hypothetical protein
MSELLFGFRNLTNIRDPKRNMFLNLGSFLMDDEYVRKFNPKRYAFYIKFLTGLSNPTTLYKFLYKTNESKIFHQELSNRISKITSGLSKLTPSQRIRVLKNLKILLNDENNKYDSLINALDENTKIYTGGADTYSVKKPNLPMENFIVDVNSVYPIIGNVPPKSIDDVVIHTDGTNDNNKIDSNGNIIKSSTSRAKNVNDEQILALKKIYNKYKSVSQLSPDRLNITFIDRCIFIGVTFLLRLLSLSLVYWGLNSNLINNFKNAFMYYTLIYILFFLFIIGLVNIIFYYPIFELLGNPSINYMPNILFYFYTHINGYSRLILHILILLLLLFIPFILSLDDSKRKYVNENMNISYNFKLKDKIYKTISNFSLVIFALTSIVAINY